MTISQTRVTQCCDERQVLLEGLQLRPHGRNHLQRSTRKLLLKLSAGSPPPAAISGSTAGRLWHPADVWHLDATPSVTLNFATARSPSHCGPLYARVHAACYGLRIDVQQPAVHPLRLAAAPLGSAAPQIADGLQRLLDLAKGRVLRTREAEDFVPSLQVILIQVLHMRSCGLQPTECDSICREAEGDGAPDRLLTALSVVSVVPPARTRTPVDRKPMPSLPSRQTERLLPARHIQEGGLGRHSVAAIPIPSSAGLHTTLLSCTHIQR